MGRVLRRLACWAGLVLAGVASRAGEDDLGARALRAIQARDYAGAEEALRAALEKEPDDFVALYNLACVRALRGDGEQAGDLLVRSVEKGFSDLSQLRRDPMLENARASAGYRRLVENWPVVMDAQIDARVALNKKMFGVGYRDTRDAALRLVYLTAMDEVAQRESREELSRLAGWVEKHAMGGVPAGAPGEPEAWVLIVLPRREDFQRWAAASFGAGAASLNSAVGGAYEHDLKRLVAQDLGATLRHEFVHVLHWRSMARLGQAHPIWVQEGLAALVEDMDPVAGAEGEWTPVESWRTNTARRMLRARVLLPLRQLVEADPKKFQGDRRMGMYAHARAFFLYLHRREKLLAWYEDYTKHHAEDPSGVASLEAVLERPLEEIDRDFRDWLGTIPDVAEKLTAGMATLGVQVDAGFGEGPVVAELSRRRDLPLNPGDVITHVEGRPTRDLPELLRVVTSYRPGTEVLVRWRRGTLHQSGRAVLGAFRE